MQPQVSSSPGLSSSLKALQDNAPTPALKWAGGKWSLLSQIRPHYPRVLIEGKMDTYIEPFAGGAAVFFDIIHNYPVKNAILFDINPELVTLYSVIKLKLMDLASELSILDAKYKRLPFEERQEFFYEIRNQYNTQANKNGATDPNRAALTIFLNRTCFNGLFRVNSKGKFNVPFGKYSNPRILDLKNLQAVSFALQRAQIILADFQKASEYISGKTFIYLDPPYRPLNTTSSFTSYSAEAFSDADQKRLANLFATLDRQGVNLMLSNSDPKSHNGDTFFDDLYAEFNIHRISAKRRINANATKRSEIKEILITNYR